MSHTLNLDDLEIDCTACRELREALGVIADIGERCGEGCLPGVALVGAAGPWPVIGIRCERCNNTGKVLTPAGQQLLAILRRHWITEGEKTQ